jgi:hypothetical protein
MTRKQQKARDVIADLLNDLPDACFEEYHERREICVNGWDSKLVARIVLKRLAASGFRITGMGDMR